MLHCIFGRKAFAEALVGNKVLLGVPVAAGGVGASGLLSAGES